MRSFNSQPPEGGWSAALVSGGIPYGFQLTAARRRLAAREQGVMQLEFVSTHSRPKAAGDTESSFDATAKVSTHSRPKAAGRFCAFARAFSRGFNSQPPEGGWAGELANLANKGVSTHSRPKAAGIHRWDSRKRPAVSTHSRPKAAGSYRNLTVSQQFSFNSQPPEGGWSSR